MAITNAQQYKQLLEQGGRVGLRGGGADLGAGASGMGSGQASPGPGDTGGAGGYGRDTNQFGQKGSSPTSTGNDGVQRNTGLESIRQQKIKDKIKEELLLTPIGRNKPLNRFSLYNNRFQRKKNIELAQKRALQKYKDIEQYADLMDEYGLTAEEIADKVANDPSYGYDFGELEKGLETLTSNRNTSIESTRPNLYDVNSTLQGRFSLFNPVVDKIRPDTQVTALNTLNKARDYTDLVNTADTMTNQDIRDTMTDLANRGKTEDQINPRDGGGDQIFLPITPYQQDIVEQEPELSELQQMLSDRGPLARRFAADGGIMNPNLVGGMMDGGLDEMGRQMYGLGKLVKKATRAVKKIVKSPIGKAALAYGITGGLGNLASGQKFFANFLSPTQFLGNTGSIFSKTGLQNIGARVGLGKFISPTSGSPMEFVPNKLGKFLGSPVSMITAASVLPLLGIGTGDESEEEAQVILDQSGIDIADIRANPDKYLARRFAAEGGSMKEPVAKKTMPLLDMDGMEKDYRAEGGFVPIGRMEKADDVPARLSKNEFVFTADAVRNAGDGDVDKGAEVMYNMMKNLEAGGDVSEESQGLDGARKMFQTSQRLEEVL